MRGVLSGGPGAESSGWTDGRANCTPKLNLIPSRPAGRSAVAPVPSGASRAGREARPAQFGTIEPAP
jgi:hypothetical protein